jgi:hypothetical protein
VFLGEWFAQHSSNVELEWDGAMEASNKMLAMLALYIMKDKMFQNCEWCILLVFVNQQNGE